MAVTFDGPNKLILIDTSTSLTVNYIYSQSKLWDCQHDNMQYLSPFASAGKASLGGGVYTDSIYVLSNGWKLKPVGYSANTIVSLVGTLITDNGSALTVPPTSGQPVTWQFQTSTNATIVTVSGGSGLSQAEHDQLMALYNGLTPAQQTQLGNTLTTGKFVALK